MKNALMEKIAQAVLYEGYILYPYRPSVKSRQRWTFGGLFPEAYSSAYATGDASSMVVECIVLGTHATKLEAKVRFLHLTDRQVAKLRESMLQWKPDADPAIDLVDSLPVGEKNHQPWQEAAEREVVLPSFTLGDLSAGPVSREFAFPRQNSREEIREPTGRVVGLFIREQQEIQGSIQARAEQIRPGVFKVSIRVTNRTPMQFAANGDQRIARESAMLHAMASTHATLGVIDGHFVSMTDPPDAVKDGVAACTNVGVWPVLIGEAGQTDAMLASPIILYDYPQIAPESPGDLFDGTEIDEILTLRVMTLTDEEKRNAGDVDPRADAMMKRTESLAREQLMSLHGVMKNVNPFPVSDIFPAWDAATNRPKLPSVRAGGVELHPGDRVRLRPRGGADAFDLVLDGKIATIAVIEQDYEDCIHLAVTIDEDPGADLGAAGKPGHRFFFKLDEIEPLKEDADLQPECKQS
jgi:hypothetical protein